jgi:hypothetical protein
MTQLHCALQQFLSVDALSRAFTPPFLPPFLAAVPTAGCSSPPLRVVLMSACLRATTHNVCKRVSLFIGLNNTRGKEDKLSDRVEERAFQHVPLVNSLAFLCD